MWKENCINSNLNQLVLASKRQNTKYNKINKLSSLTDTFYHLKLDQIVFFWSKEYSITFSIMCARDTLYIDVTSI